MLKTALAAGAAVTVAALVLPGQTAGHTMPPASTAGYGSVTTSGVTVKSVDYTLDALGTAITDATLSIHGDITGKTVKAGFGSTAGTTCTVGSYDTTANETAATCSGFNQSASTAGTFNVTVVS